MELKTMNRQKKQAAMISPSGLARAPLTSAVLLALSPAYAQQPVGLEEVVVTAQKRTESLQDVPISIQAIGNEQLEELHIQNFADYMKYLPSVSFQGYGPGFSVAYFRGVASGENANHSGPQPTVGMYLDEQPVTTIQGAVDVHLYDVARVEALAGPQGTLYGASSEAGTIRIITNKPDPSGFAAGYDIEGNSMMGNGGEGYVVEGFANIPVGENAAVRLVGWYKDDAGYIKNVAGTRTFTTSGGCMSNTSPAPPGCTTTFNLARDDYESYETYGARAALGINLNDNWTITPSLLAQKSTGNGTNSYDPNVGDLQVLRFYPETYEDKFLQAALTVEGKIGNFDVVYAGAYLKRDDIVNADYHEYAYFYDQLPTYDGACCVGLYWTDDAGVPLDNPSQFIHGTDGYTRQSHELRISSPQDRRVRFVAGAFYQSQDHDIFQNYQINGLGDSISVTNWPDTIWLTNQLREDKDWAIFGEVSFDITDKLTLTGGARHYDTESSLKGFFGFGAGYSSNYGEALCFSTEQFRGSPCVNLDDSISDSGQIVKLNVSYHINDDAMVYATYSEGFRPGGINRNNAPPNPPHYKPDTLTNYEIGWKSAWAGNRLRFNGAIFLEDWQDVQFSFLPPNGSGLTIIRNAGSAEIRGIEADLAWAATNKLTFSGGVSLIDAKMTSDYIPDPAEPPEAFDGDKLPVTPKFKGNLTARYEFNLGQFESYVQGAMVYNGKAWADLTRADRAVLGEQDSYTIADFSAGVVKGRYSVDLFLNNAFDERAEIFKWAACEMSVCGPGNPHVVINRPRTVGLRFSQKFGN
jgi:outer membrane receptor protein involved in Fe transport